jgi:hypothetical protein
VLLLIGFAWGGLYLHQGWQSIWQKQSTLPRPTQPYVPPVDPVLAADPDVQAAKMKVIGPLANQIRTPAGSPDAGSIDETNPADPGQPAPSTHPSTAPVSVDLVGGFRHVPPLRLFHGRMTVKGYRQLQFEVPAHSSFPRLKGSYKQLGGSATRDSGLLLLSDAQYQDFLHGQLGDAVAWNEGSSGTVDIALSPTHFQSQKYHLLLRNPSRGGIPVEVDFTVSFD